MRYYVVHAFTDALFAGNPAGVCLLDRFPEDELMLRIAAENRLSETAFAVPEGDDYTLRWFTPAVEVPLCGHATLATAYVLLRILTPERERVVFHTKSGALTVARRGDLLEMDFPIRRQQPTEVTSAMREAVGMPILEAYAGHSLMLLLESEEAVRSLAPDIERIRQLTPYHGVIVTAKGDEADFVSRFFIPTAGIAEDPVTGSTHTVLAPFWEERLGKTELVARQLSARGGTLYCRREGERVFIAGQACLYAEGKIAVYSEKEARQILYCEKCERLMDEEQGGCKKCKGRLRAPAVNDPVRLVTLYAPQANLVAPLLKDYQIPHVCTGRHGVGFTMAAGSLQEAFRFLTPYGAYARAAELIESTFGEDAEIMEAMEKERLGEE